MNKKLFIFIWLKWKIIFIIYNKILKIIYKEFQILIDFELNKKYMNNEKFD